MKSSNNLSSRKGSRKGYKDKDREVKSFQRKDELKKLVKNYYSNLNYLISQFKGKFKKRNLALFIGLFYSIFKYKAISKKLFRGLKKKLKGKISISNVLRESLYNKKKFVREAYSNCWVYVKSTLKNQFLYIIYNGKLLLKKSGGELKMVKKKDKGSFRVSYRLLDIGKKVLFALRKRFFFFMRILF